MWVCCRVEYDVEMLSVMEYEYDWNVEYVVELSMM